MFLVSFSYLKHNYFFTGSKIFIFIHLNVEITFFILLFSIILTPTSLLNTPGGSGSSIVPSYRCENTDQQLICPFHIKRDAVAQLIGSSIMTSNHCEWERCRLPNRYGGIQSGLYRVAQQWLCENRSGGRQRV